MTDTLKALDEIIAARAADREELRREEARFAKSHPHIYRREMDRLGRTWYDLSPQASELWVVSGPKGYDVDDIDPESLPDGFRW